MPRILFRRKFSVYVGVVGGVLVLIRNLDRGEYAPFLCYKHVPTRRSHTAIFWEPIYVASAIQCTVRSGPRNLDQSVCCIDYTFYGVFAMDFCL